MKRARETTANAPSSSKAGDSSNSSSSITSDSTTAKKGGADPYASGRPSQDKLDKREQAGLREKAEIESHLSVK